MQQLEQRAYTRQEIADALSVNIKDSNHFKRNVENTLSKWGYGYEYSRAAVTITQVPSTPEERLKEILIRKLDMSSQINPYAFACFLTAFNDVQLFESMPWSERMDILSGYYGVDVSERTLQNWYDKLLQLKIAHKSDERVFWRTYYCYEVKCRSIVTEDSWDDMLKYFSRKTELLQEERNRLLANGETAQTATKKAWNYAYNQLWTEFGCCYYSCKVIELGAFGELEQDILQEIYELTRELAEAGFEQEEGESYANL